MAKKVEVVGRAIEGKAKVNWRTEASVGLQIAIKDIKATKTRMPSTCKIEALKKCPVLLIFNA